MFWRPKNRNNDLERELRSHLDLEAEEQQDLGLSAEQARYAARRTLGNTTFIKEEVRAMWGWILLARIVQDIRYAARLLRNNPGFAATAIATLAIGIGANTAMFSITNAVLLRPPPYPNSNRLIRLWQSLPKMGEGHLGAAPPEFAAYRDRSRAFSGVAGYQPASFDLTGEGTPEHLSGYFATASLFSVLGVQPLVGRTFNEKEELPGAPKVVVISHRFWRRRYAEDPRIIGKLIRLNGQPYQIVGIMPKGFMFPFTAATPGAPPEVWAPLSFTAHQLTDWASSFDTKIIARLRDSVSLQQAEGDVKRVAAQFQKEHPNTYSGNVWLDATAEPWAPEFAGSTRLVLRMLTAAVGFILLIACANVANLLLARSGARQREMSIRKALGASAGRLTQQILAETAILTIAGGAIGCALAYGLLHLMNTAALMTEINISAATVEPRVLLFTFVLSGITCLLCGFAPVWTFHNAHVSEALKQSQRQSGQSRANRRAARLLIVIEVACCVVLLIASALLCRSFLRILEVPLGFDPSQTLIVRTTLNRERYSPDRRHAVERDIVSRLSAIPGVSGVALTTHVPLADERQIGFVIEGAPPNDFHWADNALVSDNYFRVMGIPLLRGRSFSDVDTPQGRPVAVINESMARQYWPKQDPVGKAFQWGGRRLTVIGIVGDVHVEGRDKPVAPTAYNSVYQIESGATTSGVYLVRVRPGQDPRKLAASAQNAIWSVDRELPILGFSTLEQVVSGSLSIRRASLLLVAGFAVIALLLALVGIYGVLSYAVTQRVQEIGVRLAVGARSVEIVTVVTAEGVKLAIWGILCGLLGGVFAERYIAGLVFGIHPFDPVSFLLGALPILAVALAASYIPARRASRVDPIVALRYE